MKLSIKDSGKATRSDLLTLLVSEGCDASLPAGVEVPAGFLSGFDGKARATRSTYTSGGGTGEVLLVGLGALDAVDGEALRRAAAVAAKAALKRECRSMHIEVSPGACEALGAQSAGRAAAEGALLATYSYDDAKSKSKACPLKGITVGGAGAAFKKGAREGEILAAASAFTRDLQNGAGNIVTPVALAKEARGIARRHPRMTAKIMDEAAMKKAGMGLLLGVSAGSVEPARLIHLTYKPKGKSRGRIAFVGKGLTFDAGGYSLKPPAKMDEMRFDMSGGAAVLGAMHALAGGLEVPFEVHGIVPSSENLIDGNATKPGDVHRGMNGTTVEILNTDAEGRLILADALSYVESKVKPDTIIDLATLTGAVIVGLGHELTGMFATTDALRDDLLAAGGVTGEEVWPLPLLDAHKDGMKGKSADLANIGSPAMGAGPSQGAAFLSHFVSADREWAHLDIAGTAWNTRDRDWVGGSTGTGVGARLLIEFLKQRA